MRVLLWMCGSCGDAKLMLGIAVHLGTEECDAPVAAGMNSTGLFR